MLSLCMVLALMPQMVFADTITGIAYLDASGAQQTCNSATVVTKDDTVWGTSGQTTWYVVQGDVTIGSRVKVDGDVHLILTDGCKLTVNGGISVLSDNNLTIYGQAKGTGTLIANADGYCAGIGGNSVNADSGTITINGGTVEATGSAGGAGIGGGNAGSGGSGTVIINGGTVEAKGNLGGAGIGGGYAGAQGAPAGSGNVTITGGTVTATSTGNNAGVGIGGGRSIGGATGSSTFNTNNGNAVIFASSIDGSDTQSGYWSGVIFVGDEGKVYGSNITPTESFEIPAGKTLTIESDKTLTIPDNKTLSIEDGGTLTNNGKIYVDGTVSGTVGGNGDVYYNLDLKNCTTDSTGMETHNGKTYAKAGDTIAITPDTPQTGYVFDKWEVSPAGVTIENNAFIMPSAALTVTAKWTACTHHGGLTHTPEVPSTYTEYGVKEYWTCSTCNMNFSDADGKTEITDLESWKADAGRIAKLPPEIIKGKGQTITAGEKKALSFTSNADYSDFLRVELDGKTLDDKNYTVEKGSTIVTLNADFVAALPAGEHTIGIVSANGTATTTFIIKEKPAADNSSDTGDSTSLPLLIGLMLLSIAGITGMTGCRRRKRIDE